MNKRELFLAGLGAVAGAAPLAAHAQAQAAAGRPNQRAVPNRKARTTVLFKTPEGWPNALAPGADGKSLWIAEQYRAPAPNDRINCNAYLVDLTGRVLKKVPTPAYNTSGMAFGSGRVFMGSDGRTTKTSGVFVVDSETNDVIAQHHHPLLRADMPQSSTHGICYGDGKIYLSVDRLDVIMRLDPNTWAPEFAFPPSPYFPRRHGIAYQAGAGLNGGGAIWEAGHSAGRAGGPSTGHTDGNPGLTKYDAATGEPLLTVDFAPGSSDPHGVAVVDGVIYCCDSGLHPGWQENDSPTHSTVFKVELI